MKIVSVEEIKNIESKTFSNYGYSLEFVQENAGVSIINILEKKVDDLYSKRVLFLVGKGNNGGDALVAARTLYNRGGHISVFVFEEDGSLSKSVKLNLNILKKMGVDAEYCYNLQEIKKLKDSILGSDIIIDGIFGIGFKGEPNDKYSKIFDMVNSFKKFTVAVDLPSGMDADKGRVKNAIFADLTITFGLPKLGFAFFPARRYLGEVVVSNVNFPRPLLDEGNSELITETMVKNLLPYRLKDSHKGIYGKLLVVGASKGYTGASIFVCKAALKVGVGLMYIATSESLNDIYESSLLEAISIPMQANTDGSFSITEKAKILDKIKEMDSVVIGPGLGKTYDKTDLLVSILKSADVPVVVDADAIRLLKEIPNFESLLSENTILTPHFGEFSYLTGIDIPTLKSDPIKHAKEFVSKTNAILVLKGNPTIIVSADGKVFLSTRGNSGLSTGGSGDVLAGMIASYVAQKRSPLDASILGVFVHGFTAELYSSQYAEESLTPSSLIDFIPLALKELRK